MTIADDPILQELAQANPAADTDHDAGQAQRVLARALDPSAGPVLDDGRRARPPRRRFGVGSLLAGASVGVVIAVVAVVVVLAIRHGGAGTRPNAAGSAPGGSVTLVYRAEPTPQHPVLTRALMQKTVVILRARVRTLGAEPGVRVRIGGAHEIVVTLPRAGVTGVGIRSIPHAEQVIGSVISSGAQLHFYDWEQNVLTPSGKTVASQLALQNPTAVMISQGTAAAAPGTGVQGLTGGVSLYQAVALASRQPEPSATASLSRLGPEYYLFGKPGSSACKTAAKASHTLPVVGEHCYLAGPDPTIGQLRSDPARPRDVAFSEGQVLKVPQGWVVLQASNAANVIGPPDATAPYFVLRDHVALSGNEITDPTATSQNGSPIVQFGFTSAGGAAFQKLTAQIAHRGRQISIGSRPLYQHFAVSYDGRLLTVPEINFAQYPNGVTAPPSASGASIQGAFTKGSARRLARQLRQGQLPITLKLVSSRSTSTHAGG